jgi:hypothetical protein
MTDHVPRLSLLEELDARQNQALDELDRLNQQVEELLKRSLAWKQELGLSGAPAASR